MGRAAKTPKFNEFRKLSNCYELSSRKNELLDHVKSKKYLVELGAGKADFAVELARRLPKLNIAAIDYKSDRLWRGAKAELAAKFENIIFVRARAEDMNQIFKSGQVSEIWLTFPDPYPKKASAKHRLTHPNYLNTYLNVLGAKGNRKLRLKTDNKKLFDWSVEQIRLFDGLEIVETTDDLHHEFAETSDARILTSYEKRYLSTGKKIYYLEAS